MNFFEGSLIAETTQSLDQLILKQAKLKKFKKKISLFREAFFLDHLI